jgi:hypothetical protein
MNLKGTGYENADWRYAAWDRDQWLAFLKKAVHVQVPYKMGSLLTDLWFPKKGSAV